MKGGNITAEKKYVWLKLKEDFFTSKRIKKLRKMAGGDTYTIIYLKMQLLSLKTDGVLKYTGLEKDFASELALDLDEATEDVNVVLMYLASCGLIETSDNVNFMLPYVVENTGRETDAAKRMREMRERNNVTPLLRERYTEKEREKEVEKEEDAERDLTLSKESVCRTKDVRHIVEAWNSLGLQQVKKVLPDSRRGKLLRARVNEYGADEVLKAIEKVRQSDFLKGEKDFIITFDWFVKPNNFPKVLEGNYDNRNRNGQQGSETSNPFLRGILKGVDNEEE